jgi:hypothetical protein
MPDAPCQRCRWRHVQAELFGGEDERCAHPRLERRPAEPGGPVRHPTLYEARTHAPGMCGPNALLFAAPPRGTRRRRAA